ncbi:MAG: hypothetical protein M0T84_12220 [Betaproteobacteria bacterium]|nr:hypothetical protein [Betaproteobacteria bacterium]
MIVGWAIDITHYYSERKIMPCIIEVLSQQPPGGRCMLYANYAKVLSTHPDAQFKVTYTEVRDAHGAGFPSLLINRVPVQPADGVILSPEDVCAALGQAGFPIGNTADILEQLNALLEQLMA